MQRHNAAVARVGVHRPNASAEHFNGIVVDNARGRDDAGVQRGRINAQGLDGRTALTHNGRIVEQEPPLALAHAARNGDDVARRVVDDRRAGLEQLALGRGVVQVIAVGVNALHDRLHFGIDRAVDGVAAGVEQILCDRLIISELFVHIGDDVVEHALNKVGVILRARGGIHPACNPRRRNKTRVPGEDERFGLCLLVLFVADLAKLVHLIKNGELALLVLLAVPVAARRIIFIGELRDADDGRRLRDAQLTNGLAEVALRRGLNTAAAVAEVDEVQVRLENFVFRVVLLEAQRTEDLCHLALYSHLVVAGHVLHDLLGNRRAAAGRRAGELAENGFRRALPVHAVVAFKALVLNGDERVPHMLGDLVDTHERAVLYAVELRQLHPLPACFILIVDCRALLERVGRDVHIQIERRMHVDHEDGEKHQAGRESNG